MEKVPDFKRIKFLNGANQIEKIDKGYSGAAKFSFNKAGEKYFLKIGHFRLSFGLEEILTESGVSSFILDFGGNIKTCGKNPTTKNGLWRVGLQKPFAPTGEYSKVIEVLDKAVATSGTYQRNFTFNGTLYHHIIDPASGFPAVQDFESVTVTLESSALADCLSTAVYVLGKEKGLLLLEKFGATAEFL